MVGQDDSFLSPTAELSTIFKQDDEGVLEFVPSFVIKFSNILLRVAKQEDGQITSQLIDLEFDISCQINNFRRNKRILAYCEDVTTSNIGGL